MTYSLSRTRDNAGDSGPMSTVLTPVYDETGKAVDITYEEFGRPKVGSAIRVGSLTARSYSAQDWWQTTLITEILEETENQVRFRTGNSEYLWTQF